MNELSNSLSAMPDGFSAVSIDELDQLEGGHFRQLDFSSYEAMYYSIATHCRALAATYGGTVVK